MHNIVAAYANVTQANVMFITIYTSLLWTSTPVFEKCHNAAQKLFRIKILNLGTFQRLVFKPWQLVRRDMLRLN